jgi:hypothetical protein
MTVTRTALRALRTVSAPHAFNVGLNLGAVAGGSLADHLHQHVVPRWGGDANFIAVIGQTKVIPQLLSETRRLLAEAWPEATGGRGPARGKAAGSDTRHRARRSSGLAPGYSGQPTARHRAGVDAQPLRASARQPGHHPGRTLARGPRRLPGCGHRRRHRRHRGRGGVVHPARTAVPRRAAGSPCSSVRHDRRRDGAGPGFSTPFGAVLDSVCDRIADGVLFAAIAWWCLASGQEALGVAALVCLVAGQVISYVKARAEGAGLTADGGLVERPSA